MCENVLYLFKCLVKFYLFTFVYIFTGEVPMNMNTDMKPPPPPPPPPMLLLPPPDQHRNNKFPEQPPPSQRPPPSRDHHSSSRSAILGERPMGNYLEYIDKDCEEKLCK